MPFKKIIRKVTKPIAKVLDKIVPNEIKPALPYLAAVAPFMLPGGGIALLNAAMNLVHEVSFNNDMDEDEAVGYDIVINACEAPFTKILSNAGYSNEKIGTIEVSIKEGDNASEWTGYNPRTEEIVNMFEAGIIDPTKVTRLALENAASVAGTLLITEAVVSNKKEKNQQPEIDPSMMMG